MADPSFQSQGPSQAQSGWGAAAQGFLQALGGGANEGYSRDQTMQKMGSMQAAALRLKQAELTSQENRDMVQPDDFNTAAAAGGLPYRVTGAVPQNWAGHVLGTAIGNQRPYLSQVGIEDRLAAQKEIEKMKSDTAKELQKMKQDWMAQHPTKTAPQFDAAKADAEGRRAVELAIGTKWKGVPLSQLPADVAQTANSVYKSTYGQSQKGIAAPGAVPDYIHVGTTGPHTGLAAPLNLLPDSWTGANRPANTVGGAAPGQDSGYQFAPADLAWVQKQRQDPANTDDVIAAHANQNGIKITPADLAKVPR